MLLSDISLVSRTAGTGEVRGRISRVVDDRQLLDGERLSQPSYQTSSEAGTHELGDQVVPHGAWRPRVHVGHELVIGAGGGAHGACVAVQHGGPGDGQEPSEGGLRTAGVMRRRSTMSLS